MELRQNRAKHKLQDGGVATVVSGHVTGDMIEFLGQFGFEGIWIETEHGPIDYADIPDLSRACDLWGMTPVVRVNLNLPGVIYRTLDVGAQGIAVPHVNTADEARAVVEACLYHPQGMRGLGGARMADFGWGLPTSEYVVEANREMLVCVQIEDVAAVENVDEILAVSDIDVFFIGPTDLAQSMGHPGDNEHPDVQKVIGETFDRIHAAGLASGTPSAAEQALKNTEAGILYHYTHIPTFMATYGRHFMETVGRA